MAESQNIPPRRRCAECGAELPEGFAASVCPKCLLQAGMDTQPVQGSEGTEVVAASRAKARGLPRPGERLGHYQLVRALGAGGMGAVFEAEDLESGRHLALKVLSQSLDAPEARERFLREGRLAASINHPNSVYVFGTEEIGGTPVISMELVAGGTLQERVQAKGPLPISEAVDAILQIIQGLEAARQIGILHRDVKPSNCFCDLDGKVKIGDFGLSISTTLRTEPALTATGMFLGTPAFCSPEQLRGDELNARSDMYSVGATLFYLLTGRTPFEEKNPVRLLATVLEQRAPSPQKLRADIPLDLAKAVLRCMEKEPGERFKDYRGLAQALAPYGSTAPNPATLGRRFLAGVLDMVLLGTFNNLLLVLFLGSPTGYLDLVYAHPRRALGWMVATLGVTLAYYSFLEGFLDATIGKAICRLRVTGPDHGPPGLWRGSVRAMMYTLLPPAPYWLCFGGNPRDLFIFRTPLQLLVAVTFFIVLALLFSTMRRRNGYAAAHDLLTRTRVVSRAAALERRRALGTSAAAPAIVGGAASIGPYQVLDTLESSAEVEWLLGYDLRLLRKVWVRKVLAETPPMPLPLRNLGRSTRLRWLAGRRSPAENWDSFEAPAGRPLCHFLREPQPWSRVRFWLYDLARELAAAEKDGTVPMTLTLEQVWVTDDGHAKLLDFPAPGLSGKSEIRNPKSENERHTPQRFLDAVAGASLAGRAEAAAKPAADAPVPVPVHARRFLEKLCQPSAMAVVAEDLHALLQRMADISRWRRAGMLAGCLFFPLLPAAMTLFAGRLMRQFDQNSQGLMELNMVLQMRTPASHFGRKPADVPDDRQFAIYIAHHYRSTITNAASWSGPMASALIKGKERTFAEHSVAEHPAPTPDEIEEADASVGTFVPKIQPFPENPPPGLFALALAGALATYVAVPALLAALLFRGGLVLLAAGVTFVRWDGLRASRLRLLWRGLMTWGCLGLGLIVFLLVQARAGKSVALAAAWLVVAGLAIVSVALPRRGLQDRLAGTWPVPR